MGCRVPVPGTVKSWEESIYETKKPYRVGAILLTALLLVASLIPACFAAGNVGEVNLHIGQTADTVYLTYTSLEETAKPVVVHGPKGKTTDTADST